MNDYGFRNGKDNFIAMQGEMKIEDARIEAAQHFSQDALDAAAVHIVGDE